MKTKSVSAFDKSRGFALHGVVLYGLLLTLAASLLLNIYQLNERNRQAVTLFNEDTMNGEVLILQRDLSTCRKEIQQKDRLIYALKHINPSTENLHDHELHSHTARH